MKIENDPYPGYDAQLDADPVAWNEDANMWFITGYDEVQTIGNDIERFSVRHGYRDSHGEEFLAKIKGSPLERLSDGLLRFSDPPCWQGIRKIHEAALPYQKFDGPESESPVLRDQFQELVTAQLEETKGRKTVEAMQEWCMPLPCLSTMKVVGIPRGDLAKMQNWILNGVLILFRQPNWDFKSDESIERANTAAEELEPYLMDLLARKREEPGDDFASRLLEVQKNSEREITDYQLYQMIVNHLMGGFHESSMAVLGDGIHMLLANKQYQDVVDDPSLVHAAVEEILRYHAYAPVNLRMAKEDVTVGGKTIKKGDHLIMNLGAAQRDPRRYENARTFDIKRPGECNGAESFGWGPHSCTGRPQIRMLANVFFETLTKTYPKLRLSQWPESCYMKLRYQPRIDIVLPESLPLALHG